MTTTLTPKERTGPIVRAWRLVLWTVLPALAILMVLGYIGDAVVNHVYPPVVPVSGVSMRPTLQAGDLVFLKGVSPATLRVGDVIAVNVPSVDQKQYGLPSRIVHRIEHIKHDQLGLLFITKGDANAGADVFTTRSNNVIGELRFKITGLGYPFLFFRSRQGLIFLGATALLFALYFIMGMFEDRRVAIEGSAMTMEMLFEETHELRDALHMTSDLTAAHSVTRTDAEVQRGMAELKQEVRQAREGGERTGDAMHELAGAISEYGEHLRSHTAVMQNLAATTLELQHATSELREAVTTRTLGSPPSLPPEVASSILEGYHTTVPSRTRAGLPPDLARQRATLAVRAEKVDGLLAMMLANGATLH